MRVIAAVLLAVIAVVVAADEESQQPLDHPLILPMGENGLSRAKRQTYYYYLCGTYPNQFYSYYPCSYYTSTCRNGGVKIGVGCTVASQCTPYYSGVVTCLDNCCCSVPTIVTTTTTAPLFTATCWLGQPATQTCAGRTCPAGQACTNGLCCPQTQAWQFACGGQEAAAACLNGACGQGFSCTTSNYCCECPVGRTGGLAVNGVCPTGYVRNALNNNCCATCPSGRSPLGACTSTGACPTGYICSPGNLCCQNVALG